MPKNKVRSVPLPAESTLAGSYGYADLADSFAIALPHGMQADVDVLARAVLGDPSWWFRALLACRDAFVLPFGVKSSRQLRDELRASGAQHIDFFRVVDRPANEVVIGQDDHHLHFKTSVLVRPGQQDGQHEVVATTVVSCNSSFGHAYIFVVAPLHRLIVRSNLARAAAKGWRGERRRA